MLKKLIAKNPSKVKRFSLASIVLLFGLSLSINMFTTTWVGTLISISVLAFFVLFSKAMKIEHSEALERYNEAFSEAFKSFSPSEAPSDEVTFNDVEEN